MKEVLIVLASPNSPQGKLGDIALDRLNCCLSMFNPKENLILCTGGFGKNFNITNKPHAEYAIEYLVGKGINKAFFMGIAMSSNTVDDAVKVKEILSNSKFSVKIITSDFHLERVKIIFEQILIGVQKEYYGVGHKLSIKIKHELLEHEKKAIEEIEKNGIYLKK